MNMNKDSSLLNLQAYPQNYKVQYNCFGMVNNFDRLNNYRLYITHKSIYVSLNGEMCNSAILQS